MKNTLLLILLFIASDIMAQSTILFVGDSLTAGYGIDKSKTYPVLVQKYLKNKLKKEVKIINGSVSGSTSASAISRIKWFMRANPNILVLALGSNDGLRGINLDQTKNNLNKAIKLALSKKMKVIVAGMMLPPNYGGQYTQKFKNLFLELKKENDIILIPFLLKDVAAVKNLNLSDGIHPNEKGHEIIANTVTPYLKQAL
jgi:acyl-CoA thioesterase-1